MKLNLDELNRGSNQRLSIWFFIAALTSLIVLFISTQFALDSTPKPLKIGDDFDKFTADYAYEHVRQLSVEIGSRFTGSEANEVLTVEYLIGEIQKVQFDMKEGTKIEYEVQRGEGHFVEEWLAFKSVNIYRGIQNVVARIMPRDAKETDHHILLNAHFDNVVLSPGAGDDGTMVAVILEMMRILAKNPLKHPVIFLFNGCEENSLQGAHSFVKNHRWMSHVSLLINLDVAGAGGKELMFQTTKGHPWLMKKYVKAVPNPFATVLGEEMYQNGFVSSDTDFSMFTQHHPNLPAYDLALILNGYVYHTVNDGIEHVSKGSLQSTGDNVLALLREIDESPELDEEPEEGAEGLVFFDFFGLFMISFSMTVLRALNSLAFIANFGVIGWMLFLIKKLMVLTYSKILLEFLIAFGTQILGIGVGFGFFIFSAFLIKVMGIPMFWFSNSWLTFGIYFCPFLFFMVLFPYLYIRRREEKSLSTSYFVHLQVMAFASILCIILIILTGFNIRSSFLFLFAIIFWLGSSIVNAAFGLLHGKNWFFFHLIFQILPVTFYFYMMNLVYNAFIPTMGRDYDGAMTNPEYIIGGATVLFCILTLGFLAPTLILFAGRFYIITSIPLVFIIFFIMIWTPLGHPFRDYNQVQRFQVMHFEAEFFNYDTSLRKRETGYFMYTYDSQKFTLVKDKVRHFHLSQSLKKRCDVEVLCGIPLYHIYFGQASAESRWIPRALEPEFRPNITVGRSYLKLTKKEENVGYSVFHFTMRGPSHQSIQISPAPGVKLARWSFTEPVIVQDNHKMEIHGKTVYFVNYVHGVADYAEEDYTFWLAFENTQESEFPYTFTIAHSAQYLKRPETHTDDFEQFAKSWPKWTSVQYWTSLYSSYDIV